MGTVSPHHDLSSRILSMVAAQSGLLMDQVLDRCPDTTWNQIFSAVDRLSRTGQIRLTARAPGVYRIDIPVINNDLSTHEQSRIESQTFTGEFVYEPVQRFNTFQT